MRSGGFQRCGMVQQRSCHAACACWTGTTFFDWAHILSVPAQSCVLRQSGGAAPAVNKLTKVERALRCQSHPETCCPCGKDTVRLVELLVTGIVACEKAPTMSTPSATQTRRSEACYSSRIRHGTLLLTFCETDAHGITWPCWALQ